MFNERPPAINLVRWFLIFNKFKLEITWLFLFPPQLCQTRLLSLPISKANLAALSSELRGPVHAEQLR